MEEKRLSPWTGNNISFQSFDGFVAVDPRDPEKQYWTATISDVERKKIGVLYTDDGGDTWQDHAVQETALNYRTYAIGGAREVTSDGYIIGTFTISHSVPARVYFFKIPAGLGN